MMRLAGCIMLLSSSAALGFSAANAIKERAKELEYLAFSINTMELELSGKRTPLPELLQRAEACAGGRIGLLYRLCQSRLARREGVTFSEIWSDSAKRSQLHISTKETLLLYELGNILGRYDAESQCSALRAAREQFAACALEAKEQFSRLGRVYSTLGITVGALLSIVLM